MERLNKAQVYAILRIKVNKVPHFLRINRYNLFNDSCTIKVISMIRYNISTIVLSIMLFVAKSEDSGFCSDTSQAVGLLDIGLNL